MSRLKRDLKLFWMAVLLILLAGCTISKDYGPYSGKVVDAETNEPIEGAAVFIRFHTIFQLSPGGAVYKYADAVEAMTDANGEFNIPTYKVEAFRMFHAWDLYEDVIIFKPGYGVFPEHPGSGSDSLRGRRLLAENKHITVKLPKLTTTEERLDNIRMLHIPDFDAPYEKQENIIDLKNSERKALGLNISVKKQKLNKGK